MLKNVLLKTLRDKRKSFLWWGIGVGFLLLYYNLAFLLMKDSLSSFNQLMENEFIKGMMGGIYDMSTPAGWLNTELLPLLGPIVFIVFSVSFASSSLTGEEEEGTLNLLLTNPVSRVEVYLQKFFALMAGIVVLGLYFWVGNIVTTSLANMGLSFLSLAEVSFSLVLLGAVFGSFTLAFGGLTGSRGIGTAAASAVGIISYLVNSMAEVVESLEPFRPASVFHYYDGAEVLQNGIDFGDVGIMLAATVVLFAIGMYGFGRRDIGT